MVWSVALLLLVAGCDDDSGATSPEAFPPHIETLETEGEETGLLRFRARGFPFGVRADVWLTATGSNHESPFRLSYDATVEGLAPGTYQVDARVIWSPIIRTSRTR